MDEIYTFSQNTVSLDVGNNSNSVVDADSPPTVVITDNNTNVVLATLTASKKLNGVYETTIPFNLTTRERDFKVAWTYNISSQPITQIQYFNVVTPYLSLNDLRSISSLGKTDDELRMLEKTVRAVINNYCSQSFGSRNKTYIVSATYGQDIKLPERVWNINSIYSQYDTNTDLYANGVWVLSDPYTLTSLYNYSYGEVFYEDWLVTGPIQAPITYTDQHYFVPHQYKMTVTGDFGWQQIPSDIVWAAKRLANTYLCNDDAYRVGGVQAIGSNTWTLEFTKTSYSTGDVDVDRILNAYYTPRVAVI